MENPSLNWLRTMTLSREGDRREGILFRQGRGWIQVPGAGHETLAVLADCLQKDDYIYPYYRERALALARGVSNYELALAFFARADGCSAGRLMSSHYSDRALNIFPSATPTGLQCLPATGTAWAFKLRGQRHAALCCIGDASTRQGEFYEAWCFALQENLPVVFVVEDNGYGITTPTRNMTPWNIGALASERRFVVNGRDAHAVHACGEQLLNEARSGGGPSVLWLEIDRLWSHTASDDHRVYRPQTELDAMTGRDPIELLKARLIDEGELDEDDWRAERAQIRASVEADYARAEGAPAPKTQWTNREMEAEARAASPPRSVAPREPQTMLSALNAALHRRFAAEPNALFFGEDVEDPKGGVFGLTKGLSDKFPDRVFNSPLAEATIMGAASGLSVAGMKPIFEIQFVDFVATALNQLMNQLATLRWRSNQNWKSPGIFFMPCGGYLPSGGPWHSQSNEALFAHIPGVLLAYPSTPHDAVALLETAYELDDPVVFLLPKHLLRRKWEWDVPAPKGFGQASVRLAGEDATIVTWGNGIEVSLSAAAELEKEDISVEVLDLRTLVPCDWAAIQRSLAVTGRLIVVHEDNETCGFGQAIIARATTDAEFWNQLAARPQLVARPDAHIPFHPDLELALLPSIGDVKDAVRRAMEE